MAVFYWWFVTAPTGIWHAVTPLSAARLIAGLALYAGYGLATVFASGFVLLGAARLLRLTRRSLADGYRKTTIR
jgi:hypothetical protein